MITTVMNVARRAAELLHKAIRLARGLRPAGRRRAGAGGSGRAPRHWVGEPRRCHQQVHVSVQRGAERHRVLREGRRRLRRPRDQALLPRCCTCRRKTVLAVAATNSDFFVQIGRLIIEFKDSNTHRVRSWTLPKSPAALTSAGLYSVGNTLWSWTDWATDQSGFEFANVNRIVTSSTAVHVVSKNVAYPADMSADKSGLYYQATIGSKDYLVRVSPSGHVTKRIDKNIDAPLALAGGRVFLLAQHFPSGKQFLDAFRGSKTCTAFSRSRSRRRCTTSRAPATACSCSSPARSASCPRPPAR